MNTIRDSVERSLIVEPGEPADGPEIDFSRTISLEPPFNGQRLTPELTPSGLPPLILSLDEEESACPPSPSIARTPCAESSLRPEDVSCSLETSLTSKGAVSLGLRVKAGNFEHSLTLTLDGGRIYTDLHTPWPSTYRLNR